MVYLTKIINENRNELLQSETIQKFCYCYIANKNILETLAIDLIGPEEILAAQGYKSISPDPFAISKTLNSQPIRGIDYTTNVFKLLGVYLASGKIIHEKVEEKFQHSSLKYKYLISRVLPEFQDEFLQFISQESIEQTSYLKILRYIYLDESGEEIDSDITELINGELDTIDLILMEELQTTFIAKNIVRTTFINHDAKTIVKQVLLQFGNTVKKITRNRRKGHEEFEINDEYDVQDLLYVMLKPLFPKMIDEEPTPKVGSKYNKIDLIIREEGLMIEVKMIKDSDTDEKKFVEQLKNDIQSYYRYRFLSDLLIFVYDPQNKTKDSQNFYELNGVQEIQGIRFNVEVIVGN